jgi:hypothetical protein
MATLPPLPDLAEAHQLRKMMLQKEPLQSEVRDQALAPQDRYTLPLEHLTRALDRLLKWASLES